MSGVVRGPQLARLLGSWRSTRSPEYAALASGIRGLLRDGRLALGVRLPAERELAEALDISRTTVTAAYRELRESGHLSSRRGAGSWTALPSGQRISTSGAWSPIEDLGIIDLGQAALPAPPQLTEAVAEAVVDLPRYTRGAGYHPTGLPVLRAAVAAGFAARGLPTHPEQIMITNGVQHAVDMLLRLLLSPGQAVLVETPTYPNVLAALRAHRARVQTYNLDPSAGWDPDMLLASIRGGRPRVAYLIPEFHNPTGHLMPVGLREKVAAAAHSAGAELVIDESFVDLPLDGQEMPPPVATFDRHSRVLTTGGMTKPYWGGLRVGWIRAPAPVIARLAALRVAIDMAGPVLDQLTAVRLLERAPEVLAARRLELAHKRDTLLEALATELPEWSCQRPTGGVCLWAELDAPISTALAYAAEERGVRLAAGPRFGVDGTMERYVRLPYTLPESDLRDAMHRLDAARRDLDRARPPELPPALVA